MFDPGFLEFECVPDCHRRCNFKSRNHGRRRISDNRETIESVMHGDGAAMTNSLDLFTPLFTADCGKLIAGAAPAGPDGGYAAPAGGGVAATLNPLRLLPRLLLRLAPRIQMGVEPRFSAEMRN